MLSKVWTSEKAGFYGFCCNCSVKGGLLENASVFSDLPGLVWTYPKSNEMRKGLNVDLLSEGKEKCCSCVSVSSLSFSERRNISSDT